MQSTHLAGRNTKLKSMSKIKIISILTVVVITGSVGYWLISPLFLTKEVNEGVEEIVKKDDLIAGPEIIRFGTFVGADNFHQAAGTVNLLKAGEKYYIRFENNFMVTNGPDLFVHFGKNGKYAAEARIDSLKGNIGSQNYEVPNNINPLDYNEVWIWCRSFAVPFGTAKIN